MSNKYPVIGKTSYYIISVKVKGFGIGDTQNVDSKKTIWMSKKSTARVDYESRRTDSSDR